MKKNIGVFVQVVLLIGAMFAFSHFVSEGFETVSAYEEFLPEENNPSDDWVELQSGTSSDNQIHICSETNDNKICQPMLGSDCGFYCSGECYEGALEDMSSGNICELGTCYDEHEGICEPRSPREKCESEGGAFFNKEIESVSECSLKCCVAGSQAWLSTGRECTKFAEDHGLEIGIGATFRDVGSELECIALAYEDNKGACVFEVSGQEKNGCTFTTGGECGQINGVFHQDLLCSNEDLNTICERQSYTSCVEGLDEIYWHDSCDNKENIYEGSSSNDKEDSWNDGEVKDKEDSCVLGNDNDPVRNQGKCGNCNRLESSFCGERIEGVQELDDSDQDFVCLDMGCYEDGDRIREHGESWCTYQSEIGLAGVNENEVDLGLGLVSSVLPQLSIGGDKAVDSPGSTHFRKSCLNGKIETTSCGSYRNGICTEDRGESEDGSRDFSQASCKINRWQECLAYNPSESESNLIATAAGEQASKIIKAKLESTCGLDPDCFVKDVKVDKYFQFSYCAPRYPPGFDVREAPDAADQICARATQTCTVVYVKKISGWDCEANCDCEDNKLGQQMGELCTSLGDCGLSTNYVGENPGGAGHYVGRKRGNVQDILNSNSPDFDFGGLLGVGAPDYSEPIEGEYIDSNKSLKDDAQGNSLIDAFANLNLANLIGDALGRNAPEHPKGSSVSGLEVAKVPGALGAGAFAGAHIFREGVVILSKAGLSAGSAPSSSLLGYTKGFAGAAVGAAIVAFAIDALGLGPGLSKGMTYGLIGAGAVIGASVVASGSIGAGCAALGPLCAALVIFMAILKFAGVGDVKEKKYIYECKPWVPPRNGDCESCGIDDLSDGSSEFPCNEYSCESLGQNCQYEIETESPTGGLCISTDSNDAQAPRVIDEWDEVLSAGFRTSSFSSDGFTLEKEGDSECIDQFESVSFGFKLDEYGRCSVSGEPKENFEEMGRFGLLSRDQKYTFNSLDFVDLGFEGLSVEERNDISLYFACEDVMGNNDPHNPFVVDLCVIPRDLTPPRITTPTTSFNLPFNASSHEVIFYTTEPSECRWDYEDKSYSEMGNNFECVMDLFLRNGGLFECKGEVPMNSDSANIAIRCIDHPEWVGTEREDERNENVQGVGIVLTKSSSALVINSLSPGNEIIVSGMEITPVTIEASTSGGFDGSAQCSYSIDNSGEVLFESTGGTEHGQLLSSMSEGTYELGVNCVDEAGNTAETNSTFSIEVKSTIPKVGRVYSSSGILYVVTNEKAECSYSTNSCGFDVVDGESFDSNSAKTTHFTNFDDEETYYVKCKDEFGNEKIGECDIVVKGGAF